VNHQPTRTPTVTQKLKLKCFRVIFEKVFFLGFTKTNCFANSEVFLKKIKNKRKNGQKIKEIKQKEVQNKF
jgi:hypothetical protein